jgi:hypothetical protein
MKREEDMTRRRIGTLWGVLVAVMLGVTLTDTTEAMAQEQGANLDSFQMGKLQDQLELDVTPVPVGMGALFVPSLTDPTLEPRVIVFSGVDRVASGTTGKRIVLPPGTYRVVFGAGPEQARATREVRVVEGVTTPLEPFFGAVRVTAVNTKGRPVPTEYVIASRGNDTVWGPRDTAEDASYNKTPTWILPPGRYTIALGDDPETDESRFVISVGEGEVLRYRLVVDNEKIVRVEFAEREVVVEPSIWRLQWVLGGDFGFERTSRQLASFNGDALRIGAYTNATVGLDTGNHLALLNVRLDESWIALESEFGRGLPLQKLTDELNTQLLYNYRLGGIVGPYVRASGRTSFFDTYYFPERDVTYQTTDADGDVSSPREADPGDEVTLFNRFYPLILQEGAGIGLTFVDNKYVTFIVRGGAAARQSFYNGGRFITSIDTGRVNMLRLSDKQDYGGEATAVFGLRFGGVFSLESNFESFLPQDQIFQQTTFRPVYRLDNTVALSLGPFAALVYDLTFRRDDTQIEDMQIRHNLSLRIQSTLF